MTNLPTHLQERIEQEAAKEASENGKGFLAGASFLYSLLKEEKGEVAGVWRKGLKTPQDSEWKIIVVENVARTAKYNKDSGYFIDTRGNLFEPKTLKWLDTETPVVAGCGELVEALEWYADPGNYLDENGNLATAWKNNEAIARKATSALKTFKR
jgi:hypothetical protein